MKVHLAHLSERKILGGWTDFAVFNARTQTGTEDKNRELLGKLTETARSAGYKIDHAALAFRQNGRLRYYGPGNIVDYLSRHGVPRWTGTIEI